MPITYTQCKLYKMSHFSNTCKLHVLRESTEQSSNSTPTSLNKTSLNDRIPGVFDFFMTKISLTVEDSKITPFK